MLFTSGYTQNAIVHGGRLDAGFHLLSKPYSREQLASKIRQMLGPSGMADVQPPLAAPPTEPPPHEPPVAPANLTILVVDDDNGSREAISELLTGMGYDVRQAADAEAGLHTLMTGKIDVLLTDIVLPGRSGVELAKAAIERNPGIKIVFVSGSDGPRPNEVGFDCTSLRKPFAIEQLHALIGAIHGGGETGRKS